MKIAIAQINPSMGNLSANTKKITQVLQKSQDTDLTVFPELAICGYPPTDLFFESDFWEELEEKFSRLCQTFASTSFIMGLPIREKKHIFNAAAFVHEGKVTFTHKKLLLPNYDIFDEKRYFSAAQEVTPFKAFGMNIGLTVCEDMWPDFVEEVHYAIDPIEELAKHPLDLMINISASPYHYKKEDERLRVLQNATKLLDCPVIFANLVGGNDEVLFDGRSLYLNAQGKVLHQAKNFEEDYLTIDTQLKPSAVSASETPKLETLHQALIMGTRDFIYKCSTQDVVIGLSGGIDSALTLEIAVAALGSQNVHAVCMPSPFTRDISIEDAKQLAQNLKVDFHVLPIEEHMKEFEKQLSPLFKERSPDTTEENIQARIRGTLLMALSNKFGWMVLNTSNKSELAVGYSTLYGDAIGSVSVIGDVYKTQVYELSTFINRTQEIIPERIITRPPSAELRPDQKDSDSLPPYDVLDSLIRLRVEENQSAEKIISQGFDAALVTRVIGLIQRSEFKRKQFPPILRVSQKAFGIGRRMPIAHQGNV